jgi:hypothetical protein
MYSPFTYCAPIADRDGKPYTLWDYSCDDIPGYVTSGHGDCYNYATGEYLNQQGVNALFDGLGDPESVKFYGIEFTGGKLRVYIDMTVEQSEQLCEAWWDRKVARANTNQ